MSSLWAVLLAGGSGTRFWPASRRLRPKQLLTLGGEEPLLAATSARLGKLVPPERQLVVTSERYVGAVAELLPDVPPSQIIGEPVGRDTAPCIGLAGRIVAHLDPDATVVAMPSDHVVTNVARFREQLAVAVEALEAHPRSLLVFGIPPTHAATGYGYLRRGDPLGEFGGQAVYSLDAFIEKPDEQRAASMIAEGGYAWNAGLFAFRPAALQAAYDKHLPEAGPRLEHIAAAWEHDGRGSGLRFEQAMAEEFPLLPAVSIDFGIMEKLADVLMLPMDVGWDDMGSWSSLSGVYAASDEGNVVVGDTLALDARRNILAALDDGVVAVRGVDDLIVVHTADATLVCRKDDDQGVRQIVQQLEERGLGRVL